MVSRPEAVRGIKAVLLDVDGTLYRQGPLRRRMAVELLAHAAIHPSSGARTIAILRTFRRLREDLRGTVPDGGSCEALQYERPAAALGIPVGEVRQTVAAWIHERPLEHLRTCLRPGLFRFLRACRDRGLAVGALSDYPPGRKLAAIGVDPFFGLELCSTAPEINAFKPSPAGVLHASRTWGLSPAEVLVVGDRAGVDGGAAQAAGSPFVLVGGAGSGLAARDFLDLSRIMGFAGEA